MGNFAVLAIAALLATMAASEASAASALDRIRKEQTIRIAFREDAPPFSYKGNGTEPQGLIVDLCRAVTANLAKQLNLPGLKVSYVPVNSTNRLEAVQKNKADMLCEATTATLARRKTVDFSLSTFVDGASIMIRPDGPKSVKELAGRKIGVLGGTTTEQALRNTLTRLGITADIVLLKSHDEGVKMLVDNAISAYFADRAILQYLFLKSPAAANLMLSDDYLTVEPYALALPRGDEDFRLAVDTALSHIYRSGEIVRIFTANFGAQAVPSPMLQTLYTITGLPD
jgi:polar amino acid transport system substrate-binding protein/glutamate/aspartate transport system substrate-binding protein